MTQLLYSKVQTPKKQVLRDPKDVHKNVHSIFIHKSWQLEITQTSIKSRMDKLTVDCYTSVKKNELVWLQECGRISDMMLRERRQTQRNVLRAPIWVKFRSRTTWSQRSSDYFWGRRAGLAGRAKGGACWVAKSVSRAWSWSWLHKGRTMWKLSGFVLRFMSCIMCALPWCCWWWRWWRCGWGCEWPRWWWQWWEIVAGKSHGSSEAEPSGTQTGGLLNPHLTATLWMFIKWK